MTRERRTTTGLTPAPRRRMLLSMFHGRTSLRVAIALIVVLAMGIAGPIHAAHHHANDALHATCAICQFHSPACPTLLAPGASVSLEPIHTLAVSAAPAPHAAPVTVAGTRAPPSFVA